MVSRPTLIAIVGPTASGKSSLAVSLAKKFDGEIVCADSRTIYKGMDIGTAKPSLAERENIPHHCLDIVNPDKRFSAVQFQKMANRAIAGIRSRGKIPFLVGGSGLYADSVLYDFEFGDYRQIDLENMSLKQLQKMAEEEGLSPTAQTLQNQRHLAGLIKRGGVSGKRRLNSSTIVLGVKIDKDKLNLRIEQRVNKMFEDGLVEETNSLLEKWGASAPGLLTPGYGPAMDFIQGKVDLKEAKRMFISNDKQLAKRQLTWFKRNKDIQWVSSLEEAEQLIEGKTSKV